MTFIRGDGAPVRFVLVSGESTAGNSRAAAEAVRAELGGFRLLMPHSAADLVKVLDAGLDVRRCVVWLDELQELLRQPEGPRAMRRLLGLGRGPTALVATMRTDAENEVRATPEWRTIAERAVGSPCHGVLKATS